MLGKLELTFGHRLLRKHLITEHALRPGVIGQYLERLQAVLACLGLTAQAGQKPPKGLPLSQ